MHTLYIYAEGLSMATQDIVWAVTLMVISLIALAFIHVVVQAGRTAESALVHRRSNIIRLWWFWALILIGLVSTFLTLWPFPLADQRVPAAAAQIVNATGRQWSWELSEHQFKVGTPVEFNVTSIDVNHGFAIYGPDGRIVTQTQAMPGFTNRLLHTFDKPGTYRVLCLEYCGVAHHAMITEFTVVAQQGAPQ